MTKVRTTFDPGTVLDVDDAEFTDLHRQGLLNSYEHGNTPLEEGMAPWVDGEPVTIEPGQLGEVTPEGDDATKTAKKKGDGK